MNAGTRESSIAIGFCFPVIDGVLVALRFYTRAHQKSPRRVDDWLCLPAWLFLTGCCAALLTGTYKKVFVEQPVASPDSISVEQRALAQSTAAMLKCYIVSNALIKLSILFFYRRIFIGRVFSICNWTLIGLSFFWSIYAFVSSLLFCGIHVREGFEGGWTVCDPWGFKLQIGVFCLDNVIDLSLLILPVPLLWRLKLSMSRKLVIVMIFMLGGFAFIAGVINTVIQIVHSTQPSIIESGGQDEFFKGFAVLYNWIAIEIGVGLIACNLPSLSFHFTQALPRKIRHVWNLSWSQVGSAADQVLLRFHSNRDAQIMGNEKNVPASDSCNGDHGSLFSLQQRSSPAPNSHGLRDNRNPEHNAANDHCADWMGNNNSKVVQGFDAV